MSDGVKKSNFIATSDVADASTFDFVENSTNKKITKADLVTKFGVTGSLEQLGEATSVPVLKKTGTVNNIRNITGGSGVVVSLSPEDGITIDHNFGVDKTGVPISAVQRNLSAGSPGNLTLLWGLELATSDYIEFYVENNDTSVNVVINNAIARVD